MAEIVILKMLTRAKETLKKKLGFILRHNWSIRQCELYYIYILNAMNVFWEMNTYITDYQKLLFYSADEEIAVKRVLMSQIDSILILN